MPAIEFVSLGFVRDINFNTGLRIVSPEDDLWDGVNALVLVNPKLFTLPLSLLTKGEEAENNLIGNILKT
jgi:hypothetical protein